MIAALMAKLRNKHFMSLAGNVAMAGLAMLTIALLYRSLSLEEIGYWFFYQTLFMLIDTFRTGFLQVALIKFYTGTEPRRAAEVLGSVWFLAVLITGIVIGVNLLLVPFMGSFTNTGFLITIQWFGLTFLATLPYSIASWIQQSDQRFDRLLILRVINQGSFIISVVLLIFFKSIDLQMILLMNFVSNALVSIVTILLGWTRFKTFFSRTSACIKEVYHFGKFSVGTTISANLLRSSDIFIITYMLGPAAVAVYNIPVRLMELIEIPIRSTVATGMSSLAKAFNKNNLKEVGYILQKYAGTLTVAFIPVAIGAILLADIGVGILGGGKYINTEAANVYRMMMFLAIFYPIDRFIGVSLDIIHQPQVNLVKVIMMVIANITGDFVGIALLGNIYGVALGTLLPLCVGVFYGYYRLNKYVPFKLSGIFVFGYIQNRSLYRKYILKK
ncbi:MAG: oligosaccharide flippase family protein [Sediminibacterium sp.]|nr:oligosaccharide flippase family protein [Sediminibacterium sp.]